MHLRWKATLPIIAAITFGVVATIIVTGIATKQVVLEEVKNSTLPGYRDIVLNSLVTMMTEKNYRDSRNQYLKQMKQLVDFRIIRADVLNQKYGNGNLCRYNKKTCSMATEYQKLVMSAEAEIQFINDDLKIGYREVCSKVN